MEDGSTEFSILQWPGDLRTNVETDRQARVETERQMGVETGKDDRISVRSDVISCTESERMLIVKREKRGGGASEQPETGLVTHKKEEEPVENQLPGKAAQVFAPAATILHSSPSSPKESREFWEMELEKSLFLAPEGTPHHENHFDWEEDTNPSTCRCTVYLSVEGRAANCMDGVLMFVCPSV